MKKASLLLTGLFLFLVTLTVNAQDAAKDYFTGKWDVLVEGSPSGDTHMLVTLERVDGKLTGTIARTGSPVAKIIRVEEKKDKSVTIYFNSSGYDVYLFMEKKGENKTEGSMMDMFDATGKRIVDEK